MSEHAVDRSWSSHRVARCRSTATAIEGALAHLQNVVEALEGDRELVSQTRALAALLRTRRDDLVSEAGRLEAAELDLERDAG